MIKSRQTNSNLSYTESFQMTPASQFLVSIIIFTITVSGSNAVLCPIIEKQALLSFKNSVKHSSTGNDILSSWLIQTDCCTWTGVVCSNLTGHVLELHLQGPDEEDSGLFGDFQLPGPEEEDSRLSGELNDSLLNVTQLEYLDLSENSFQGTIPAFIGSFAKLKYLNLSNAGFDVDNLKWLSSLSGLEHLDMSYLDISKEVNWLKEINILSSLVELRFKESRLSGKLDDSLLNLIHLRILDLSINSFEGPVPAFIGSFPKLEYLDLTRAGFNEIISHAVGNISSLRTLVLEGLDMNVDGLDWLSGLPHLEHLNMNNVNLRKAINWQQVINKMPSLLELRFSSCSLLDIPTLNTRVNFSSLSILDLSSNNFKYVPTWISQLNQLTYLDLSANGLQQSVFPSAANLTRLRDIFISLNQFESIPDWLYECKCLENIFARANFFRGSIRSAIGNITTLQHLDLSNNELSGNIPGEITNLCHMQRLILSNNKFHGDISSSFENMSSCFSESLEILHLERNNFSGHLSSKFGELKHLRWFYIAYNSLYGPLPVTIGQLYNLEIFDMSYNMLEGVVTEMHFANLTKLYEFSASRNRNLTLKVSERWIPPFKASFLHLGSWNLGFDGLMPAWIHTQKKKLDTLDLSDTGLISEIPSWFLEIHFLNLSHNQLRGKVPNVIGNSYKAQYILLSNNLISGSLPRVSRMVIALDLSNNLFSGSLSTLLCDTTYESYQLQFLHLGGNSLSGELPDCWAKWTSLMVLNLGNNNLSGRMPESLGYLEDLQILDLYNNKLFGEIPNALQSCSRLMKFDVAGNYLVGNIPAWLSISMTNLRILIFRSNRFFGNISTSICYLRSLQILDLSQNMFSGIIPICVDNLTAMELEPETERIPEQYDWLSKEWYFGFSVDVYTVESASVSMSGKLSQYDTILDLVTVIDLSSNNLSGDIPTQLTRLTELRSLNLSKNHLKGSIPSGIGGMKQLLSLDLSRNSLSGEIPGTMSALSLINNLDLSYNNLTGRIPQSTQITTLSPSGFIGNKLCGPPLPTDCKNGGKTARPEHEHDNVDKGGKSEVDWFYIVFSIGYAVGLSAICNALIFKKSWRDAFFGSVYNMWNKFYVFIYKERNLSV